MADILAPNQWKGGQSRIFLQEFAGDELQFYGCAQLDGLSQDLGEPELVYCPSTTVREQWDIVEVVKRAPSLATADLMVRADRYLRDIWWDLKQRGCRFKLHVISSGCARPDDHSQWDGRVLIDDASMTTFGLENSFNPLTGDDNQPINLTLPLSIRKFMAIRQMAFKEVAAATLVAEALDGVYYDAPQCGECGVPSDGANRLYFLAAANSGSPGLSSQLLYTLNAGDSWATLDIPVFAGASGNRIAAVGSRMLVFSQAYGGYAWSEFADINAGTVAWTGVTSGFVAAKSPRAVWSKSSFETFVAGQAGYIYLITVPGDAPSRVLTDGSITIQDFNDIHGFDRNIVAVGTGNVVLKSTNNGDSWQSITGPLPGQSLSAVAVLRRDFWYVGTGTGRLYRTRDGGTTWTQVTLPTTITTINDIQFFDENVGYMAVEIAGAGRVYRTVDGGFSWDYQNQIKSLPTSQRINVAIPNPVNPNLVAVGGRKTVGGDGLIAIAS